MPMPTYEYSCRKCGHQFEYSQSMKAAALEICPADVCPRKKWGKGAVQRGIGGGAGLIFKGSGFYITDYRSEGYKTAAKGDVESSKPKTETPAPAKSPEKTSSGPASAKP
jgi:putative FmdB family regulatory protein